MLEQLARAAMLDDAAVHDADDAIAIAHRQQPMGDDDDGAACDDLAHVVLDDALAVVVERAGRLIEDQDARVGRERPRDRDALALAAGQVGAALLDHGVVALRQPRDELMRAGELGDSGSRARAASPDWRARCCRGCVRLNSRFSCSTTPIWRAQPCRVDLGDIDAVDQHLALVGRVEALQQFGQGRLAGARMARRCR